MNDRRGRSWRVAAAIALAMAAAMPGCRRSAPEPPPVLATLPPFVLEDQAQRSIDLADLRGSVWVAHFFSTKCQGPWAPDASRPSWSGVMGRVR